MTPQPSHHGYRTIKNDGIYEHVHACRKAEHFQPSEPCETLQDPVWQGGYVVNEQVPFTKAKQGRR